MPKPEQKERKFTCARGSRLRGDLVRGAVQLGRAVEQMMDDAPTRDGTTTSLHIDSKRRKKLKQKKTALGHAEDDHVDWTMEQHL